MPLECPEEDLVRLLHMRDAAREALTFSDGRQRADVESDRMYFRAIVSCIQEIGEAAVRVTEPTRDQLEQVPWRQIIAMRNRLVHTYFSIKADLVWQVVEQDLQPLLNELEPLLPEGI